MRKKTTNTEETQQPAHVAELLLNGTVTLSAKTREDLTKMVGEIPSEVHYCVGAVGFNPDSGVFSLRVDITNQ